MRSILLATALSLSAAPALAQSGPPGGGSGGGGPGGGGPGGGPPGGGPPGGARPPRPMKPITREQLDKAVASMFQIADRDRNGTVTLAELHAVIDERREALIHARFERIDTDHNRSISEAEFLTWQRGVGSVASSEPQLAAKVVGPIAETIGPKLDDNERGEALGRVIEPLSAMMIVNADANHDGALSLDELLAYQRKRFDGADVDHDGELTMGELRSLDPERNRFGPGGPGFPGGPIGRRPGDRE